MATPINTLNYSLVRIPARAQWMCSVDIARADVPELCKALSFIIRERFGAVLSTPNFDKELNELRFEWFFPSMDGIEFFYRLGIHLFVDKNALKNIECYAAYGESHPQKGEIPSLSSAEHNYLWKEIQAVFDEADKYTNGTSDTTMEPIYYIEMPPGHEVPEDLSLLGGKIRVYKTVKNHSDSMTMSCVAVSVPTKYKTEARLIGKTELDTFLALLSLAKGASYTHVAPKWPESAGSPPAFLSDFPDGRPYPELWEDVMLYTGHNKIDESVDKLLKAFHSLEEGLKSKVLDSVHAYFTGIQIHSSHPTLAVIPYVAALSPFGRPKSCDGSIACSKCGPLSFKHNLEGERAALHSALIELLSIPSEHQKHVEGLIKRVYRDQRSPFVHGATFRHGEFGKDQELDFLPSDNLVVSESYQYKYDLLILQSLTRSALTQWIYTASGECLSESTKITGFEPKKVSLNMSFAGPPGIGIGMIIQEPDNEAGE